jgi:hypothetical protein
MNITISLSPEQELQLREGLQRRDRKQVREILREAIDPTVDTLLETDRRLSTSEFERLANELVNRVKTATGGQTPILHDEDINRSGIYGDHP